MLASFRVWAGAGRKEPGRHLNHDLFADVEGGDGVVDQLADDRSRAVVRPDLFFGRRCFVEARRSVSSTSSTE